MLVLMGDNGEGFINLRIPGHAGRDGVAPLRLREKLLSSETLPPYMTHNKPLDLERILRHTPRSALKSEGERRIADFLDHYGIEYIYEAPTAVTQRNKVRIWYPDFYLPEYGLYIEYYGRQGDSDYDRGVAEKTAAYNASGLEVIPVYQHHLSSFWPDYLTREIREITQYRTDLVSAKLLPYVPGSHRIKLP